MSSEFDKNQLVDIFVAESSDAVSSMQAALNPADQSLPSPQVAHEQKTLAHRTKGAALLYEFPILGKLCDMLEHILERTTDFSSSDWPRVVGTLRALVDAAQLQINSIAHSHQELADSLTAVESEYAEVLMLLKATEEPSQAHPLDTSYLIPTIDNEVMSYFIPEMEEHLARIQSHLEHLSANPDDPDRVHQLFRSVHTVKGSSHTVGFTVIGDVVLPLEERLCETRDDRSAISAPLLELTAETVRIVRQLLAREPVQLDSLQRSVPALMSRLKATRPASMLGSDLGQQTGSPTAMPSGGAVVTAQEDASVAESTHHPEELTLGYLFPGLDPEVLSYFVPEAQEHLDTLEALLLKLEKTPDSMELIHQLFRSAHTLKGSALTVGFTSIGDLVHYVEDLMGSLREGRRELLVGMTDLIFRSIDVVRLLMRRDPSTLAQVRERFRAVAKELQGFAKSDSASRTVASAQATSPAEQTALPASDGREAPPSEEAAGPQGHDVIRVNRERLERLLNLVGELVIGRGRLEQRLLVLEHLSNQVQSYKGKMVDTVRSFEEKHSFTLPATTPSADALSSAAHIPGLQDFGALEFDKYDDFNILARRISEVTADVTEAMAQLSGSIRHAREDMSQLQHLTLGMRDEIARARMVAIGTPFTRFRRAVREMARATGKEVTLVTSGEHTEVDTGIVERLVEPLVHLVRNAVYHGIEPTGVRVTQCKPAVGTVYLHAAHRGNAVIIEVEDDGAGIDTEKVKAKAVAKGLVSASLAKTMPESEAMKLIFAPGFSTADEVGDQAGRGVGLDAVKKVIESMNGFVDIETARGVGTKFTLSLPLTLLIATALIVRAGAQRYAIPLPSVREVTIPTRDSLQRVASDLVLQVGREAIPVQSLTHALSGVFTEVPELSPIVIVRAPNGSLGLAVDELLGRQEIVVKSLGSLKVLERSAFGGASIDPEGRVILVVDVTRIGQTDRATALAAIHPAEPLQLSDRSSSSDATVQTEPSSGPSILLIDDSLSIRKFVARMLESAGYAVETAVDGEDGLRKAAANRYRLVITDLEMPKLNGYEVIQALRGRAQTQTLPIVVMTTRAGDKHRQLALNIGASGYIAKPVEERALIAEVERWVQLPSSTRT
ncbi:MAG: Hpt domain-containing protein [Nitrospiraceae bacterium]